MAMLCLDLYIFKKHVYGNVSLIIIIRDCGFLYVGLLSPLPYLIHNSTLFWTEISKQKVISTEYDNEV